MTKLVVSQQDWYSFQNKFASGELGRGIRKGQAFCNYFAVNTNTNVDKRYEKLYETTGREADVLIGQLVSIDCGNNQSWEPFV